MELATRGRGRGEGGAKGPLPTARPGDWWCACGNLCFARRDTCVLCGSARPDVPQEERDGAGGGFMERDLDEELRPREPNSYDEVDEFDDFGRKKKKFRLRKQG